MIYHGYVKSTWTHGNFLGIFLFCSQDDRHLSISSNPTETILRRLPETSLPFEPWKKIISLVIIILICSMYGIFTNIWVIYGDRKKSYVESSTLGPQLGSPGPFRHRQSTGLNAPWIISTAVLLSSFDAISYRIGGFYRSKKEETKPEGFKVLFLGL